MLRTVRALCCERVKRACLDHSADCAPDFPALRFGEMARVQHNEQGYH
jgi:hypothetical protein